MKGTLIIALILAGSTVASARTLRPTARRVIPALRIPQRRITSPSDPMFGHLIGRSRSEVFVVKGEPSLKQPNAWVYSQQLGPGAHSFRYSWVVKFSRGKVVEIDEVEEAIGCILIPPPREP